jgi:hypothetical protein
MARKRMIDPSIFTGPDLGELPPMPRFLFHALISMSDDKGRFSADPRFLKSAIFPYDDSTTVEAIRDALALLAARVSDLVLYEVAGRPYGLFRKWFQYQYIQKPQDSRIPIPDGWRIGTVTDQNGRRVDRYLGPDDPDDDAADNDTVVLSDSDDTSTIAVTDEYHLNKKENKKGNKKEKGKEERARAAPAALDWRAVYRDVNKLNLDSSVEALLGDEFAAEFERLGEGEFRARLLWWLSVGGGKRNAEKQLETLRRGVDAMKAKPAPSPPPPTDGPRLKSGEVVR